MIDVLDHRQANPAGGEEDLESSFLYYRSPASGGGGWGCVFTSGRVSSPLFVVVIWEMDGRHSLFFLL